MPFQIDINGVAHPLPSRPLLPPRPLGVFAVVLHDYETSEYFRADWNTSVPRGLFEDNDRLKNEQGWPEMVPFEPRMGVKLTEELQWFWFKQLVLSQYGHADIDTLTPEESWVLGLQWQWLCRENLRKLAVSFNMRCAPANTCGELAQGNWAYNLYMAPKWLNTKAVVLRLIWVGIGIFIGILLAQSDEVLRFLSPAPKSNR